MRRRWPIKNLFSQARSLAALPLSKKVLDGRPSPFAKTIPSMRKKGEKKNGSTSSRLALVAYGNARDATPILLLKTQNQRKEVGRYATSPLNFHDHLVLETEPDFMIILRLENAAGLRRWREVNSRPYRETLQTTGFYMGRVVIVPREFASVPSPPPRRLRETQKLPGLRF